MKRIEAVNDFVIKFANVNGSGSASANELFAKAVMRMGVPVSPRNIFPSNIQGMPTWYEARVCEKGYHGRRGGVDMMVAMNPQTWDADIAEIESGGYLFYDSTRPMPTSKFRDDVHTMGVPLTEIANNAYTDPRQRQLFKNIIYVGALSVLLDVDAEVFEKLFAEQFKGKERLLESNIQALHLGRDYVKNHMQAPLGIRVQRADNVGDQIFTDGNSAAGLGLVYGGATVAAWYPIIAARDDGHEPEREDRREDDFEAHPLDASACRGRAGALGAGWNGARTFTATSGPGVSLMTEFIGLAYFAEIPVTIINVQRGGPSTGMPTRTQQSDLLSCAYASHGDTKHVLLFPQDPHECFTHSAAALDLAERLQTPIFVMTDLDIGMNQRLCKPFVWDDTKEYDRGKIMTAEELEAGKPFGRYRDVDGDGIPWRTLPGTHPSKGAFFTRGTSRNPQAMYSEAGADYIYNMERLIRKFKTAADLVPQPIFRKAKQPTKLGVIYYGSTTPAMREALDVLERNGDHVDAMRLCAFPFPESVSKFIAEHDKVFVAEQNRDGQMRTMLINELEVNPAKLIRVLHYDGTPITARFIIRSIHESVAKEAV